VIPATDPTFRHQTLVPADLDSDGTPEYLTLFLSLSDISPEDGMSDLVNPELYVDAIGLAPQFDTESYWDFPFERGKDITLTEEQVEWLGLTDATTLQVYSTQGTNIFQYQIDDGIFRTSYDGKLEIPKQFYGYHVIRVWAVQNSTLEAVPSSLKYYLPEPEEKAGNTTVIGCAVNPNDPNMLLQILFIVILVWMLHRPKNKN
jgi:hypothetical protein